jgi:hypothetical protein
VGDIVTEGLHEGLVGDPEVLVAATGQHDGTLLVDRSCQFSGEPCLADAGFPRQEGDPPLAGDDLLPELVEPSELVIASHEDPPDVGEEGGHRNGGLGSCLPEHLNGGHRLRQTLQLEGAEIHEGGVGASERKRFGDVGREDLPAVGGAHEAGRLDHGRSEHITVLKGDLADGKPDLDRQRHPYRTGLPLRRLLHGDRAGDSVDGRMERHHDAVARVLDLLSAGAVDGLGERGEVGSAQLVEGPLTETGHEVRGAHEVGEEHRHNPARPSRTHRGRVRRNPGQRRLRSPDASRGGTVLFRVGQPVHWLCRCVDKRVVQRARAARVDEEGNQTVPAARATFRQLAFGSCALFEILLRRGRLWGGTWFLSAQDAPELKGLDGMWDPVRRR